MAPRVSIRLLLLLMATYLIGNLLFALRVVLFRDQAPSHPPPGRQHWAQHAKGDAHPAPPRAEHPRGPGHKRASAAHLDPPPPVRHSRRAPPRSADTHSAGSGQHQHSLTAGGGGGGHRAHADEERVRQHGSPPPDGPEAVARHVAESVATPVAADSDSAEGSGAAPAGGGAGASSGAADGAAAQGGGASSAGTTDGGDSGSESDSEVDDPRGGGEHVGGSPHDEGGTIDPLPLGGADRIIGDADWKRWHPQLLQSDGRPSTAGLAFQRTQAPIRQFSLSPADEVPTDYTPSGWIKKCNKNHSAPHKRHGRAMGCSPHLNFTQLCGPVPRPKFLIYPRKQKRATVVPGRVINVSRTIYRGVWGPFVTNMKPVRLMKEIEQMKNARMHYLNGTEMPESINDYPVAESHNGEHDIFKRWPTERQVGEKVSGRVERAQWGIQFFRDPRNVSSHPQLAEGQPPAWVAVLEDVWLFMGSAFMCGWALTSGGCQLDIMAYVDAWWAVDRAVVICDGECNNYYHFMIEHLPRLALVYDMMMRDESITLLVPQLSQRRAPFIREMVVGILGIDETRLISSDSRAPQWRSAQETVFVRKAFVPAPTICGRPLGHALYAMRDIIFRRLGLPSVAQGAAMPLRVILAERGKYRMPQNWESVRADVVSRFSPDQVAFGSVGNRSVEGQIRIFNRADLVIGPHGANMANIVWMRAGTTCLEFMSYHYGNMCYFGISSRLGLTHRFILHSASKKGHYNISADEVAKHITDAMKRANAQRGLSFT